MNKRLTLIIILIMIVSSIVPFTDSVCGANNLFSVDNTFSEYSEQIYVNISGSDDNNGLSPKSPKRTVKNATDSLSPNGVIYVAAGDYNENNITINKNVTILGENQLNSRLDGNNIDRIFFIEAGAKVILKNIELIRGNAKDNGTYNEPNGYGGAIYNLGNLNIFKCNFTYNNGKNLGGAIYNGENSTINIVNSTFIGNHADFYGGAVSNSGLSKVANCIFINNLVGNNYAKGVNKGGAIYNYENGIMNVTSTTFTSNHADFYGGAVYSAGNLNIGGSIFTNNVGVYSGGAIYNTYNVLTVTGTNFVNNSAEIRGGAIYNAYNLLNATATNFTANHGKDGGAIYNAYNLSRVNNSNFTNNYVTRYGGAISSNGDLEITTSNFVNNNAQKCGGAFYLRRGTSQIHFNRIVDNHADTINNIGFDSSLGGMVDATLNWWGSNTVHPEQFTTNVKYDPWLILTLNTTPTNINITDRATVKTELCFDNRILNDPTHSNNYYHNSMNGHVPDGIMVKFTTSNGNMDPIQSFMANGNTKTKFTRLNIDPSTIKAICDNQIVETNVFKHKIPTKIIIQSSNGSVRYKINITAILINKNHIPMVGNIINFKVNNKSIGNIITDINGKAEIEYILPYAGNYTITASFIGTDNYEPSEDTKLFTIHNNSEPQPPNPQPVPDNPKNLYNGSIQKSTPNIPHDMGVLQQEISVQNNSTNNTNLSKNQQNQTTTNPWPLLIIIPIILAAYILYNKKLK